MSHFEERYDQIELYLKNKLEGEELRFFQKELENNSELQEEVKLQQATMEIFEHDYLSEMSKIIKEETSSKPPKGKGFLYFGLGALVILTTVFLFYNFYESETSELKDTHKKNELVEPVKEEDVPIIEENKELHEQKTQKQETGNDLINSSDGMLDTNTTFKQEVTDTMTEIISLDGMNLVDTVVDPIDQNNKTVVPPLAQNKSCLEKPRLNIKPIQTDLGETNGQLVITNETGRSLEYSLDKELFSDEDRFEYLEKGNYHLWVSENDTCYYDFGIYEIKEDPCLKEKNYGFNRSLNSEWILDLKSDAFKELIIVNKLGKEVVHIEELNDGEFVWNGYYENGQVAEIGIHIVYCTNDMGKKCKYNVVVSK